jgi:ATP-dependent Clp protease adapter protein ClpS
MKRFDTYDILISSMGYSIDGITKHIIEQNQAEIISLKEELGITKKSDQFNLILLDDDIHDQLEVVSDLLEIGCGDKSLNIMYEAHNTGFAIVKTGPYRELVQLRNKLREEKYKTLIRRVEKE